MQKKNVIVQGTDHGSEYNSGPAYRCYAIYVSKDAQRSSALQVGVNLTLFYTVMEERQESGGP